jgi:hypothetical protein
MILGLAHGGETKTMRIEMNKHTWRLGVVDETDGIIAAGCLGGKERGKKSCKGGREKRWPLRKEQNA